MLANRSVTLVVGDDEDDIGLFGGSDVDREEKGENSKHVALYAHEP